MGPTYTIGMSKRIPHFSRMQDHDYITSLDKVDRTEPYYYSPLSSSQVGKSDFNRFLSEQGVRARPSYWSRGQCKDIRSVISLINNSTKILVILGAGGSVGPDFRSPGGLYDSIAKAAVLEDPSQVFEIDTFFQDPSIFWRFAHTIFPSEKPEHSKVHFFIEELQRRGKLLRLYSQNVDTLEVGISPEKLRCVHGSWRENKCHRCGAVHSIEDIRPHVVSGTVPVCQFCAGPIKPGIVFFGESTNLNRVEAEMDAMEADLLLVIGTSLRVAPISEFPKYMPNIPSILINRTVIDCQFSARLLGECSDIIDYIEAELGWDDDSNILVNQIQNYQPNIFIFPSNSPLASRVVQNPRSDFLVTSVPCDVADLM